MTRPDLSLITLSHLKLPSFRQAHRHLILTLSEVLALPDGNSVYYVAGYRAVRVGNG